VVAGDLISESVCVLDVDPRWARLASGVVFESAWAVMEGRVVVALGGLLAAPRSDCNEWLVACAGGLVARKGCRFSSCASKAVVNIRQ
jgi:hypothetical protein